MYHYYTVHPSGEYKYYANPEGILEPCFTVKYDEYEGIDTTVNGIKVTMEEAEKRHKSFVEGCADDETDLFFFETPGEVSHLADVQAMNEDCAARLSAAA